MFNSRAAIVILAAAAAPALAQHHHAEMMLGWETATNRLHVHAHGDAMPYALPLSPFAGINGWAAADVAFTSAETAHPALGTVVIPQNSDVRAVLVAADPGIQVFSGIQPLAIGGEFLLGAPVIHFMPVYNVPTGSMGDTKSMTFVFRDASGQMTDSLPYTVSFVTVPGPAGVLGLGAGLLALRRRR